MSDQTYRKDEGKLPIGEIYKQFPTAIEEIAKVIAFGEKKYKRHSWVKIDNFQDRAFNSLHRHLLAPLANRETIDPESNCLHLAHAAWNILALLEYTLTAANREHPEIFKGPYAVQESPSDLPFLSESEVQAIERRLRWLNDERLFRDEALSSGWYMQEEFTRDLNRCLSKIGGRCE